MAMKLNGHPDFFRQCPAPVVDSEGIIITQCIAVPYSVGSMLLGGQPELDEVIDVCP